MQHRSTTYLVGIMLLVLAGCGGNPEGRKAISGTVMIDGEPAESGTIEFQPLDGGSLGSGAAISDGNFSMEEEKGLPPGKYRVAIFASQAQDVQLPEGFMPGDELPPVPQELVPPEWNTESTQTVEVKESGPFEFDFNIPTAKKTTPQK